MPNDDYEVPKKGECYQTHQRPQKEILRLDDRSKGLDYPSVHYFDRSLSYYVVVAFVFECTARHSKAKVNYETTEVR